ncbi:MAG: methyl-accepting chemotaxis protein [Eubacteriales bacterium]|nr:methyl-accepting chemotaxis protein [Eubacteriales bacterium]
MENKERKVGSLGSKVSLIVVCSVLVSTLAIGIFCYFAYRDNSIQLTGEKALGAAQSIASGIDGDKFVEYDQTGVTDEYFETVKATMSEMKKRNGPEYVYSLADAGENYKLIISGYLEGEDQTAWGYLGYTDPKNIYAEQTELVFKDGVGRYTEPQDYGPGYGILISGFAPILDSKGNVVGVVGTDFPMNEQIAKINQLIPIMGAMIAVTSALLILITYLIIRKIIALPLRGIAEKSKLLVLGDTDLHMEKKYLGRNDEVGLLSRGFADIAENMQLQAGVADALAAGDLSTELTPRSEKDVLGKSIVFVIKTLRELVQEAEKMTVSAVAGKLGERGNDEKFSGGYRQIIAGFNETMDAVVNPLRLAADNMDAISKGDIPTPINKELNGEFNDLKNSLNRCIAAVGLLVADTKMLSDGAIQGDFEVRADENKHLGDFRKVIEGVNQTLDTVVDKAVWYQAIIDSIPFPIHVTDMDMKWTLFNSAFEKVMVEQGVVKTREEAYGMDCWHAGANICNTEGCGIKRLVEKGEGETFFEWGGKNNKQDTAYLKDKNGQNIGFVEVVTDLTGIIRVRNYTETEVHRLENNLKLLAGGNLEFDLNIANADEYTAEVSEQFQAIGQSIAEVKEALSNLTQDAEKMTTAAVEGDLSNRADVSRHGGEFAKIMEGSYQGDHQEIKNAMNETIQNLVTYVEEISDTLAAVADGDLDLEVTTDFRGDFVEIKNSLNNIVSSLSDVLGDISVASDQVASGSRQVSDGSQALSQGSTEQASSVQELTASIAEVAGQTKQNAVSAGQAKQLAEEARINAVKGDNHMKEMLHSMEDISESSANIYKIIKVIDEIAFQTNILALNAATDSPWRF